MKNILKIIFLISTLVSSAFAYENKIYAIGNFSLIKLNKVKGARSPRDYSFSAGVGMNVLDNIRADISFENVLNLKLKKGKGNRSIKAKIQNLMLNAYIDFFDFGYGKIFAGAGTGFSQVRAKISGDSDVDNNGTAKKANNVVLAGYFGASKEFAPGMIAEIKYGYKDFGKSESLNKNNYEFRGHQITIGARLDF